MKHKEISIAIIQHNSEPCDYDGNIKRVEKYLRELKNKNIQLVVLPELFATGYCANQNIFRFGENEDGRTLNWMKEAAKLCNLHIGGGIPIFSEGELYNRFYIVDQFGDICGYAQKELSESYCFKRNEGIFYINTKLGKIGVSICADSHSTSVIKGLQKIDIDILLMPHAWPTLISGSQDEMDFLLSVVRILRIPIVFVNGIGNIESIQGLMGKLMHPSKFKLRGKSCIIDSNENILGSLGPEPGILKCKVKIEKNLFEKMEIPDYDGWIHDGSRIIRRIIIPFDICRGKKKYKKNLKLKELRNFT